MARFKKIILILCLILSLTACRNEKYPIEDYLVYLAEKSGLSESEDTDEAFDSLLRWGVVSDQDYKRIYEDLDYDFLARTLGAFLKTDGSLEAFKEKGFIDNVRGSDYVKETKAKEIVDEVIYEINHPEYTSEYSFEYADDVLTIEDRSEIDENYEGIVYIASENSYMKFLDGEFTECDFEEIFDDFDLSESFEIDFNDADIQMNGTEEESSYVNSNYELLAKTSKVFNIEGFRVSYSISSSGISFRVSKSVKDGLTGYGDITLSNIKPSVSYHFEDKQLKDASLLIDYKSTGRFGFSTSRYKKLAGDFKNADSSSFKSLLTTFFKERKDCVEATIPICTIETPIPNVPTATFGVEVLLNLYASGKAELVLYDTNSFGFEIKDGNIRTVSETDHNYDFVLRASAKSSLGLNFNVSAAKKRIMDIELDGGIKAEVRSTLHLYDQDGEETVEESDLSYDALETLSEENEDVKVCGDLSLRWVLDLKFNTYRSLLYKYGLTYTKEFMDDDNQVFGNLHHIENGQFVEKCTRNSKTSYKTKSIHVSSDNILLSDYSIVLKKNESYTIEPVLPDGYTNSDLVYSFSKEDIVSVTNNVVTALNSGAVKITISTDDQQYSVCLNVLVSYE